MQILVEPSDWGEAQVPEIQRLLDDVSWQLLHHFSDPPAGRIRVQCRSQEGCPRVLYRAAPGDDHVVWLTARHRFWCQLAYQFAHELCHIVSDFQRLQSPANEWFHESLCELASIYAIGQMSRTWPAAPPYPNWRSYAESLRAYADELTARDARKLPPGVTLGRWLCLHEPSLRADPCQREINGLVAVQLLPLFQRAPAQWQSIRFLPDSGDSFAEFLGQWQLACPVEHQEFISEIGSLFEIAVA